jgi:hypothetical protein
MSTRDSAIALSYPLTWPVGWPRAVKRQAAAFTRQRTMVQAREHALNELRRLGARAVVISSNVQVRADGLPRSGQTEPSDRGVAVYFTLFDKPQVLACDKWLRTVDNLYAIGQHVYAVRAQARYGVGTLEQAFQGYLALTPPPTDWQILGVPPGSSVQVINRAFRERAEHVHPDRGGDHDEMARLTAARARLVQAAQEGVPHGA